MTTLWLPEVLLKHVGVREFRDTATRLLSNNEILAVERHGELIGFYIPVKARNDDEVRRSLEQLEAAVQRVLTESGMSEEELAKAFDLTRTAS